MNTTAVNISPESSAYSVFKQDGSHQFYCRWTIEEDMLLSKAVADHGPHKWTLVSQHIPGRTAVQCSTRWFGALNPNVHKGRWSNHEDQALTRAVHYFQSISKTSSSLPWNRIAENIPHRTGIQCQARWTEALDPAVRKGRWHPDEDKLLSAAIAQYGCCWIRVASMIPTRTQRQCRTRWNQIHSQQLKMASVAKGHNSNKRPSSSLVDSSPPAIKFDFVNTQQQQQQQKQIEIESPTSPTAIEDILAQYGSSASTTTSRSSSYSVSPPVLFTAMPLTEKRNLLQHNNLFPPISSNDSSIQSSYLNNNNDNMSNNNHSAAAMTVPNFLYSSDFDFLLTYDS